MRLIRSRGLSFIAITVLASVAGAQSDAGSPVGPAAVKASNPSAVPTIRAARREGPVVLDGKLDESAWQKASAAGDFTESYPNAGAPAAARTEVRVLYDDAALYVAVRMFDSHPDSIAAQLGRRDVSGIYSDWVHVIVDSYHDRRTAFRFTVNPRGVQKDVYTSNDGNEDVNWDAVWEVATSVDNEGWNAEYRIPFSQLRFGSSDSSERIWGFQVMRDVARRNERTSFSPWTPQVPGFVSRFGDLAGLIAIPNPSRLEVQPYVSSQVTRAPGDNADPFYDKTDLKPSVGADVRWGIPGGLTLTATVNPDFGQVEVDPASLNLSAFETFLEEKRPFFLEASDVFAFGQVRRHNDFGNHTFLYSRRIGRQPRRSPSGDAAYYSDVPAQTRIAGAAKVTGKNGPWTVGLLDAVTLEEKADIATVAGAKSETPVEPLANYLAARVRRDFNEGRTVIGAMATHTARDMSGTLFDASIPASSRLEGIDFEHSWNNRIWTISGFGAVSSVEGTNAFITNLQRNSIHALNRPDAVRLKYRPTRTSLHGHLSEIAINKGGSLFGSVAIKNASPTFDINDFGFSGRMDYRALSQLVGYEDTKVRKVTRNRSIYVYSNHVWNFDRARIYEGYAFGTNASFTNFWQYGLTGNWNPEYYADRLTRGGAVAATPAGWRLGLDFGTDSRKPIIFYPYAAYREDESGMHGVEAALTVQMRPTTSLRVSFSPYMDFSTTRSQYHQLQEDPTATRTYGRRDVFADVDQRVLSLDTRIEWTLTPRLSLQTYLQPFVASGNYFNYKEFQTPREFDFLIYGKEGTSTIQPENGQFRVDPDGAGGADSFLIDNGNFNQRSLNGNAVLRWEYRPGSALFFVWQQSRSEYSPRGDFEARRDVADIFKTVPTNVFLVKATYWFSR